MKITVVAASACVAALVGFSASFASATTLQFENIVQPGSFYLGSNTSYTESEYALNSSSSLWGIVSPTYSNALWFGPTSNSDFFSTGAASTLTLTNTQNSTFSLDSIDVGAGIFSYSANPFQGTIVSFHGLTNGGVDVSYDFALTDNAWHTLSFSGNPDFENLQSLSITLSNPNNTLYSVALDNINVSAVPIPQSFYLLGSALLPLFSTAFRKRKNFGL